MAVVDPQQPRSSTQDVSSKRKRNDLLAIRPLRSVVWLVNGLWGVSAAVIGIHDLLSLRAAERATGVMLAVGGVVLAASARWALSAEKGDNRIRKSRAASLALGGFLLGLVPGASLIYVQSSSVGYSFRMLFWVLALLFPAVGVFLLWREEVRLEFLGSTGSIALLAASIALLPPLAGGAFRSVVNPTIVYARMDLEVVGRRNDAKLGDVAILECKLTIKNIGKRRLVFVGSLYSVMGIDSRQRRSASEDKWPMASELQDQNWSGRFESPWEVISVAEIGYDMFSPGDILEPDQEVEITLLPVVPYRQYDTVEAYAVAATAFEDRLQFGTQHTSVDEQALWWNTPLQAVWDIEPTSWVAWLTQGPQNLQVEYGMGGEEPRFEGLYLEVGTGKDLLPRQGRPLGEYNPRSFTLYGLGSTTASDSLILDSESPEQR
jgi:hypothetical protein